ncbi:UDP-2,4-diacetamido-2,4,6-trideoxy-beta-L-altropyranose hydrolase [Zobellella sp. An-6]|uniref:UDP-2,4-diacetamido-2,4, 6-trideoxy-beta-L-altropyranose hydrolase n=1 Tax=Zobellella sp. An-6 TaxID=3400218 RepID=UPI004041F2B2
MNIIFRTDASLEIGSGHVMRCLTLAQALKGKGAKCQFICREHPGNLVEHIRQQGFQVHVLPKEDYCSREKEPLTHSDWLGASQHQDAERCKVILEQLKPHWLIIDHYAIDHYWQTAMRAYCVKIMVIDDLADRIHDCDLLLDQNFSSNSATRYAEVTPVHCIRLLGPEYALLQPKYAELHQQTGPRKGPVRKIFAYFGGVDHFDLNSLCIHAFNSQQQADLQLDLVVSPLSHNARAVSELAKSNQRIRLHQVLPSLAPLMSQADLAIGAGGSTSWERCCLGLPTLVITLAANQKNIARKLDQQGYIHWLGDAQQITANTLIQAMEQALSENLELWSNHCRQLVDGLGTQRVVASLFGQATNKTNCTHSMR